MTSRCALAVLAFAFIALAGCSGGTPTAEPSSTPAAVGPIASSPAASRSAPGTTFARPEDGCSALVAALAAQPGQHDLRLFTSIGNAMASAADQSVRFAGQMLVDTTATAVAAEGQSDAAKYRGSAVDAAGRLLTACRRAKLIT